MGGAAAIGASLVGGSLVQGFFANEAADRAAEANEDAANRMREASQKGLGYLRPYNEAGSLALGPLSGLLTGNQYDPKTGKTTTLDQAQRLDLFQTSPGYQFRMDEAQKALRNSQLARGNLLSGGALKELDQYTQGIASNEYNNYISQLGGLANIGQNAANSSANTALGAGSQIAGYTQAAGNAQSQGLINQGNIFGNLVSQLGGIGGLSGLGMENSSVPTANNWNYNTNAPNFSTQLKNPIIGL